MDGQDGQPHQALAQPPARAEAVDPAELQRQVHSFLTAHIPMALEDVRRMQAEEKRRQQEQGPLGNPQQQQQAQLRALQEALQQNPSGSNGQEPSITPSSSAMLILIRTRQQAAALLELLLRMTRQQLEEQQQQHQGVPPSDISVGALSVEQVIQLKETLAALDYRMGAIAAETGDSNLAARFFSSALQLWDSLPLPLGAKGSGSRVAMTLDVCNMLASLALEQGQHQVAEGLLLRAHSFYEQFKSQSPAVATSQHLNPLERSSSPTLIDLEASGSGNRAGSNEDGVEAQYTFTCFHLAQVYAALEQRARSAYFCGLTLTRQLRLRHHFTPLEWVQNCTQLASYYAGASNLPCALRCLSASRAILEMEATALADPAQAEPKAMAAANIAVATARIFMKVLQHSVEKSVQEEEAKAAGAGSKALDKAGIENSSSRDVAMETNSSSTPTLFASHDAIEAAVARGPDFSPLGVSLGGATQLLAGETSSGTVALGSQEAEEAKLLQGVEDYPGAVVLFNRSMINFKSALEFYKVDERFVDHVLLVLDISSLHKHLSYFELSPHRAALIHLRGISRLESLLPQINHKLYPQQLKQISYEIASVHLSVLSLEEEAGRTVHKIEEAYLKAIAFLDSLVQLLGPDYQRVQSEYHQLFSNAVFLLASIHHRHHKLLVPQPDPSVPTPIASQVSAGVHPYLHKSLELFSYFLRCVESFQLEVVLKEKMAVAQEMVQLVPATLELQLKHLSLE